MNFCMISTLQPPYMFGGLFVYAPVLRLLKQKIVPGRPIKPNS